MYGYLQERRDAPPFSGRAERGKRLDGGEVGRAVAPFRLRAPDIPPPLHLSGLPLETRGKVQRPPIFDSIGKKLGKKQKNRDSIYKISDKITDCNFEVTGL